MSSSKDNPKDNLTKRDIVLEIYKEAKFPQKDIRKIVQLTLDAIVHALSQGQNVELRNVGVFELQTRKERVGRNPNEPEKDIVIPKRIVVKFKPGKELRAALQKIDIDNINHVQE